MTGFCDITMTTTSGKLLSVFIMVVGVALFVQLARAMFQHSKLKHNFPECGLNRHETDAIHCKHCGDRLKIETEGDAGTRTRRRFRSLPVNAASVKKGERKTLCLLHARLQGMRTKPKKFGKTALCCHGLRFNTLRRSLSNTFR